MEYEESVDKPQPRYGHPRFYEIINTMADLHSAKAHDYAGATEDPLSNFKNVARTTNVGCPHCGHVFTLQPSQVAFILKATKFFRLVNLMALGEKAKNEPFEDTLTDDSVYSILMRILRGEEEMGRAGPATAAEFGETMRRAVSGSG